MKMNQKLYELANDQAPYEVQELEGHKVELYLMDQFEGVKEEYVIKNGKFAVWTSIDGIDYRLFLENGYYEELKDLYSSDINAIWMEFWDGADAIQKRFSKLFVYPMMGLAVVMCFLSIFLGEKMGAIGTYVILGALVVMFFVMIFANTKTKKKIVNANVESRNKIIALLGEERFDELLAKQTKYMDDYFKNLYPEDNLDEDGNPIEDNDNTIECAEDRSEPEAIDGSADPVEAEPVDIEPADIEPTDVEPVDIEPEVVDATEVVEDKEEK